VIVLQKKVTGTLKVPVTFFIHKKMLRQSEGGTLTGAISILLRFTFFARGQCKNSLNIKLEF
jgi:hypothetical protein